VHRYPPQVGERGLPLYPGHPSLVAFAATFLSAALVFERGLRRYASGNRMLELRLAPYSRGANFRYSSAKSLALRHI